MLSLLTLCLRALSEKMACLDVINKMEVNDDLKKKMIIHFLLINHAPECYKCGWFRRPLAKKWYPPKNKSPRPIIKLICRDCFECGNCKGTFKESIVNCFTAGFNCYECGCECNMGDCGGEGKASERRNLHASDESLDFDFTESDF